MEGENVASQTPPANVVNEEEDDPNAIKSEGLQFVFMAGRDNFPSNGCTYYEDGNPEMYTTENMQMRKELQSSPAIRAVINDFIDFNFQLNDKA